MSEQTTFLVLLGLTAATGAVLLMQLIWKVVARRKGRVYDRLSRPASRDSESSSPYGSIVLNNRSDELTELIKRLGSMRSFNDRLRRAYPNMILSRFLSLSLGFALLGFMGVFTLVRSVPVALGAAAVLLMVPFIAVNAKIARQQRVVNDQLPDALEFLCRVLRAGHSLATGLQMGAEELPEPLASEFGRCYDQHSLGQPIEDALREMAARVGTSDFSFFVTAVLIQRTTGGDLAEVLTNISSMIRARVRLEQHVRAVTAEGRLVGYILLVLPVVFFAILYVLNPKYAGVLINTPEGSRLLGGALLMQVLGILTIRRIVAVKM